MYIIHTKGNKIPLMSYNLKEEAETALFEYQKNIVAKIESLGYAFDILLEYLGILIQAEENCHHEYSCTCTCFDEIENHVYYEIDFESIYLDITHPLYGKKISIKEAIESFFLYPIVEEKEVLRINDISIEIGATEMISATLISSKVEELLISNTVITSITIDDEEIKCSLYLNYPFTKEEAMTVVRTPQSNSQICKFINSQHPVVKEAMLSAARRAFYRAVENAFKLVDAIKKC